MQVKRDNELTSELENVIFKNERMAALLDIVQVAVAEVCGDVPQLRGNALDYALFEICLGLHEVNEILIGLNIRADLVPRTKTSQNLTSKQEVK